ncbi:MAG: PAC2 family protein [Thermoleophilia bacterium]|nr:PAC2 family protein [Thermoleophilia bacterium]
MSDELRIDERPVLRRPILVAAFAGWNDGGSAATLAVEHLASVWGAEHFADIDPEGFFDFQSVRPTVALEDGVTRRIDWPETTFRAGTIPGGDRDVVLLSGVEPNYRWRAFCGLVTGLARELQVELVVTLGALLADVPHTRAAPVTGAASDPSLVEELGLKLSRYEGPTGIVGVLHDACRHADLPSVSLWSAVPHYVSLSPSPKGARALCEKLAEVVGVPVDVEALSSVEEDYTRQVTQAVSSDHETHAYVEELERRADTIEIFSEGGELPTGESLAEELSRFLREREATDPPA